MDSFTIFETIMDFGSVIIQSCHLPESLNAGIDSQRVQIKQSSLSGFDLKNI